jgi:hypothetical protein
MDEFSAAAALAVGIALTLTAYGVDILAYLDRVDQKFLKIVSPYFRRAKHSKKGHRRGRHHKRPNETFYCYDKKTGTKVIWT